MRAMRAKVDTTNWTRENLAWAAAFIDGEGSIYEVKDRYCVQLSAYQNDPELLERLQSILGPSGGKIYKQKPGFVWRLSKKQEVYAILVALYEWFSSRRKEQVRHMIQHRVA